MEELPLYQWSKVYRWCNKVECMCIKGMTKCNGGALQCNKVYQ